MPLKLMKKPASFFVAERRIINPFGKIINDALSKLEQYSQVEDNAIVGELKWLMISLGDPNSFEASVDKLEELCDEIFYLPDIFIETILEMALWETSVDVLDIIMSSLERLAERHADVIIAKKGPELCLQVMNTSEVELETLYNVISACYVYRKENNSDIFVTLLIILLNILKTQRNRIEFENPYERISEIMLHALEKILQEESAVPKHLKILFLKEVQNLLKNCSMCAVKLLRQSLAEVIREYLRNQVLFAAKMDYFDTDLAEMFTLINNLLPKLSEINYSGHPYYDRSASTNTIETLISSQLLDNLPLIESLIGQTIDLVFHVFLSWFHLKSTDSCLYPTVFLKMLKWSSASTLFDFINRANIWRMISFLLKSSNCKIVALTLDFVSIIMEKLYHIEHSRREFCTDGIIFQLLKIKNLSNRKILVIHASQICDKYGLGLRIISTYPFWEKLCSFKNRIDTESLRSLAEIFLEDDLKYEVVLHSGIIQGLLSYLFPGTSPKSGETDQSQLIIQRIKNFLTAFQFNKADGLSGFLVIRKFLSILKQCFQHLYKELQTIIDDENLQKTPSLYDSYTKDMEPVLILLWQIYTFNKEWGLWFDTLTYDRPFSDVDFLDDNFEAAVVRQIRQRNFANRLTMLNHSSLLIMMCPPLVSFMTKKNVYRYTEIKPKRLRVAGNWNFNYLLREVSRENALRQMMTYVGMSEENGALAFPWEFEFYNELGVGRGPTKEFYSILSKNLQEHYRNIWLGEPVSLNGMLYTFSENGLYLRPLESFKRTHCLNYQFVERLGKIFAKTIIDNKMLDLTINEAFLRRLLETKKAQNVHDLYDIITVMPHLKGFLQNLLNVKRLKSEIEENNELTFPERCQAIGSINFDEGCSFEDLQVYFTLPGCPEIELMPDGKNVMLVPGNVEKYLEGLSEVLLKNTNMHYFRQGFTSILHHSKISMFLPREVGYLLGGMEKEEWTKESIAASCLFKNGYTVDSPAVQFLLEIMSSFSGDEQRLFLQFTTSSPRLPFGGLRALRPPLQVKRILYDSDPNNHLPSSSTCINCLYLPEYTNMEIMRQMLMLALTQGQNSFQFA